MLKLALSQGDPMENEEEKKPKKAKEKTSEKKSVQDYMMVDFVNSKRVTM